MAITIDQFLRDLTDRRILSGEEASAFRRELAPAILDPHATARTGLTKNGSASDSLTQTVPAPDSTPLVLCNCLLKERIQDHDNHLIFQALHLQTNAPVSLHVLMPRGVPRNASSSATLEQAAPAPSVAGILDVGRHGEMVCVCCQTLEAESLSEIVQQYEKLPLELATESLLETVKTLKRLQNQGLQLDAVSPDQLLLDEDGHIHLAGPNPAAIVGTSWTSAGDNGPPTPALLRSLGALYLFLQTGPSERESEESGSSSAGLIYQRLTGTNGMARYNSWDDIIRDLDALLKGQELSPPIPRSSERIPDASPEPKPAAPTPAKTSAVASSSSKRGILIGLAVLCGIVIAVLAMLSR